MAPSRQLDLLVVGMASSGTTLLTNLLTCPAQERLCLNEPRLNTWRAYKEHALDYFRVLGAPEPINTRTLADFLFSQQRKGIKEIRKRHIRAALRRYEPQRIVLMVRDLRSSLVSYYEKHEKRNATEWKRPKAFPSRLFLRTAPLMLDLYRRHREQVVVVHYESFVQDEACRDQLAAQLDWPLDGDLDLFNTMRRGAESGKHDQKISTRSLARPAPRDPAVLATLTPLLARLADFQTTFNYPTQWDASEGDPTPR